MPKEQFVGTWKLVSYEHYSNGVVTYPLGENAYGLIMYDAFGSMAVQISSSDRAPFA
ncbi:MAG: hypothetical protein EXR50_02780 [Dehalococcoidia bacterium]|nr:hypothetical protein [Dehalococcoidia bacterium]